MTTTEPVNLWAQAERKSLSDLFLEVGPDAPTLCDGWSTRDLAAHLVIREGRIDAALGITIPAFAGWTERVQNHAATRPWRDLVDKVRNGPPKTSMMRLEKVDGIANTIEFFVHHEDVRRAQDGWTARELDPAFAELLWERLQGFAPRLMKPAPGGVALTLTDGRSIAAKQGTPLVTVTGDVGDLTMFAYGRRAVNVTYGGDESAIAALAAAVTGI